MLIPTYVHCSRFLLYICCFVIIIEIYILICNPTNTARFIMDFFNKYKRKCFHNSFENESDPGR